MAKEMGKAAESRPAAARAREDDPAREIVGLRDTINGLFEDFFSGRPLLASSFLSPTMGETTWIPPVDIRETESEVVVCAGILGCKKEDCKVEVRDDTLVLSGECKAEAGGAGYVRKELPEGPFYRAFTLPTAVKAEEVKASYRDGVLEIRIPKSEGARTRAVEIQ